MPKLWISLGSNLGNRLASLRQSLALFPYYSLQVLTISSLYRTEPQGVSQHQPDYFNAVVEATTVHAPLAALNALLTIETRLGRLRTIPQGPRTIDLDILLIDNFSQTTSQLTVPHPRMWQRAFVLIPLLELLPDLLLPDSRPAQPHAQVLAMAQKIERIAGPEWANLDPSPPHPPV